MKEEYEKQSDVRAFKLYLARCLADIAAGKWCHRVFGYFNERDEVVRFVVAAAHGIVWVYLMNERETVFTPLGSLKLKPKLPEGWAETETVYIEPGGFGGLDKRIIDAGGPAELNRVLAYHSDMAAVLRYHKHNKS